MLFSTIWIFIIRYETHIFGVCRTAEHTTIFVSSFFKVIFSNKWFYYVLCAHSLTQIVCKNQKHHQLPHSCWFGCCSYWAHKIILLSFVNTGMRRRALFCNASSFCHNLLYHLCSLADALIQNTDNAVYDQCYLYICFYVHAFLKCSVQNNYRCYKNIELTLV